MIPQLLVSVRNADEARAAIEGGCDILDIKEPSRGSLGRADTSVILDILNALGSDAPPVSAALGELRDFQDPSASVSLPTGIAYVKLGLAGCAALPNWGSQLQGIRDSIASGTAAVPQWVRAIYADADLANAPSISEVIRKTPSDFPVTLFDTFTKDGRTLADYVESAQLGPICTGIRQFGSRVALAGSLSAKSLSKLGKVPCDILAIRTAACRNGDRNGSICPDAIRQFKDAMQQVFS